MLERWVEAEQAAREALAIDADDSFAQNVLAIALRTQGKSEESQIAVDQLLQDDPEDEMAHLNAGYAALQTSDHRKAEGHFREALRLAPDFEPAREGLIYSFRARSGFYRLYLRYSFFMARFSEGSRWAMIIGLYLGVKFGRQALMQFSPILAGLLGIAYLLFVFWVWLADGVGGFLILCDRSARHALKKSEKLEAITVGGGFFLGIAALLAAAALRNGPLVVLGLALVAATIPASLFFTNPSPRGRLLFGSVMAATYVIGLSAAAAYAVRSDGALTDTLMSLAVVTGFAVLVCTWLGNVSALRQE